MNYPDELDTDDIEELASYIERRYPTEEIRLHDTGYLWARRYSLHLSTVWSWDRWTPTEVQ